MRDYIVSPFRPPLTPVLTFPIGGMAKCQCGNEDQDKFWTVTSLAGDTLRGFVCATCENAAVPRSKQNYLESPMSVKGNGKTIQWLRDHIDYDQDYCLIWPFFRNPNGYGQLGYLGQHHYAHRLMCRLACGEPPSSDHEAAHSCGNGHMGCASPKHLSWKTRAGNLLDCRGHGTQARSRLKQYRLTDDQVLQIMALRGKKTQSEIAIIFGVSDPTIRDIFLGRSHARPSKVKFYTPSEETLMLDAIQRGCNFTQIAKLIGRKPHAVSSWAYRKGLKSGQPVRARKSA